MRRVASVLVLIVVAACGDGGTATTVASTTTSAVTTTTGGTTTTPAPVDQCLIGRWTMGSAEVNDLLLTYLPVPNLSVVEGSLALEFTALGLYTYALDGLVVQIVIPNGYLESTGSMLTNGAWTAADGFLGLTAIGSDGGSFAWRAVINGVETPYPAGFPALDIPLPAESPYTCTDATLTLETTATETGTRFGMVFQRAG